MRAHRLEVRVTDGEKRELRDAATAAKTSMSDLVRILAISRLYQSDWQDALAMPGPETVETKNGEREQAPYKCPMGDQFFQSAKGVCSVHGRRAVPV